MDRTETNNALREIGILGIPVAIVTAGVVAVILVIAGCGSSDRILYDQALDYQRSVVDGVLLPAYESDPRWSPDQKANVQAARDDHQAFLEDWDAGHGGGEE